MSSIHEILILLFVDGAEKGQASPSSLFICKYSEGHDHRHITDARNVSSHRTESFTESVCSRQSPGFSMESQFAECSTCVRPFPVTLTLTWSGHLTLPLTINKQAKMQRASLVALH